QSSLPPLSVHRPPLPPQHSTPLAYLLHISSRCLLSPVSLQSADSQSRTAFQLVGNVHCPTMPHPQHTSRTVIAKSQFDTFLSFLLSSPLKPKISLYLLNSLQHKLQYCSHCQPHTHTTPLLSLLLSIAFSHHFFTQHITF